MEDINQKQISAAHKAILYIEQHKNDNKDLSDIIYGILNETTYMGNNINIDAVQDYTEKWKFSHVGEIQRILVNYQLDRMHKNFKVIEFTMLKQVLEQLPKSTYSLTDIGCSSGYYYEVIKCINMSIQYKGIDYNKESIDLAKYYYPDVSFNIGDITNLSCEKSDIVLLSGILEHVPDYKKSIIEVCNISKKYIILHRMLFIDTNNVYTSGTQYFVPVLRAQYNKNEIMNIFLENKFKVIYETQYYQGVNKSYILQHL